MLGQCFYKQWVGLKMSFIKAKLKSVLSFKPTILLASLLGTKHTSASSATLSHSPPGAAVVTARGVH
jgi:hypothetical protein